MRTSTETPDPLSKSQTIRSNRPVSDDERVAATQVRGVASSMRWALIGSTCGALLMAINIAAHNPTRFEREFTVWWAAILCSLQLLALWWVAKFVRTDDSDDQLLTKKSFLVCLAAGMGAFWGAPTILALSSNRDISVSVSISIGLVLVGGGGTFAIYRPAILAFVAALEVIYNAGILVLAGGSTLGLAASGATVILGGVAIAFARTQENAVAVAIRLGLEKERLIASLREQQTATDQARREAEHARQQAELANQGKTTFLAAAGHDLRQPMHALVQYFGHLKRRNRDPELHETILRIGKSLDAMQDLLDSVLEVSKLMMGSVKPTISVFKISELLERVDAQMRPIAEDKGVLLVVLGTEIYVRTDEVLLERIVRNLALNAIRYTNRGQVLIRARRRADKLVIQVFDTGIGIARKDRELIFEAFYQVANEARNRQKGLGLGLAIVKQLSELLDVSVGLRSKLGRGSIFSVELPAAAETVTAKPTTTIAAGRDFVKGSFVVLIDDNVSSLEATAASLSEFGCQVLTATSGLEAIERLQGQEFMPHLVVSDYRLEGETGLDAIKMVVDNQKALFGDDFAIAALVISGDTAPAELERVRQAGLTMLHKPVRLEALYNAVNGQLEALATSA